MDDSWDYIDLVCPVCGGKVRHYFDFNVCEDCHYTLPDSNATNTVLYNINNSGTGMAMASITPIDSKTLYIDCDLIKLYHKELDIEFKLDKKKIEGIDIIEINGYRFVKQNN